MQNSSHGGGMPILGNVYDDGDREAGLPWMYSDSIMYVPTIIIILLIPSIRRSGLNCAICHDSLPWSWLVIAKMVISIASGILFAVLSVISEPQLELYHLSNCISLVSSVLLTIWRVRCGATSSGIQHIHCWLLLFVDLPFIWNDIEDYYKSPLHPISSLVHLASFLSLLVYFIMLFFSDRRHHPIKNEHAEREASFASRLFFAWVSPILHTGYRKPIEIEDLFELNQEFTSEYLSEQWALYWNPRLDAWKKNGRDFQDGKKDKKTERPSRPSLLATLFSMFKWELIISTLLKLTAETLQFANPYLLHKLIGYLSTESAPLREGLTYVILLFVISEIRSLVINKTVYIMYGTAFKAQSVLMAAVYKKTLRLSNGSRNERTIGEIVNLMSIDVGKIKLLVVQLHAIWSCPYQMTLCLFSLFLVLGLSALPSLAVAALSVFANMFSAKIMENCQTRAMKAKDQRAKMVSEVLGGIKVVKLSAWERVMESRIDEVRDRELALIKKSMLVRQLVDALNNSSSFLIAVLCFTAYSLCSSSPLSPQTAFVALTLIEQMRMPLCIAAYIFDMIIQARVSNNRLKKFLSSQELDPAVVERSDRDGPCVVVRDLTACWSKEGEGRAAVSSVCVSSSGASLLAIVGKVGSGKSSFLSALLGEMDSSGGQVRMFGRVAYVPQQPWIQNLSLRDNILFGNKYDDRFYSKVVEACALQTDFNILPHGDQTLIGDKGITLSGGQRARVSLARAVYCRCTVYLLDDPLAAVDAHVGRHIYDKVLGPNGLLKDTTRVLVTHGLCYLKDADEILVMEEGKVVENGTYSQLSEKSGPFSDFLEEYNKTTDDEAAERESVEGEETQTIRQRSSIVAVKACGDVQEAQKEGVETGRVSTNIYRRYIRAASVKLSAPFAILVAVFLVLGAVRSFWLSIWTSKQSMDDIGYRLGVYAALGGAECASLLIAMLCLVAAGISASRRLHSPLIHSLLRTPMHFFDTTPLGRVINRCTKDIDTIDTMVPQLFYNLIYCAAQVACTLTVIAISTPIFIIVIPPLFVIYMYVLRYYVPTSRQLRRIEGITRSPIYAHFGESIQGVSCIRAFDKTSSFEFSSGLLADRLTRCCLSSIQANRWLAIRLELMGNTVIVCAALFAVLSSQLGWVSNPTLLAVSITYALNITDMLNFTVRCVSEIEASIVAVERVWEQTNTPHEAEWDKAGDVPSDWPTKGEVVFDGYAARYREDLDLVLHDISAVVQPGEKIGVVGRTGAGKSSLALALFRVVEAVRGKICIDGVDISGMGLHRLRKAITVIPQEPVLLSGTLRFNLDPLEENSDGDLWRAVQLAHLGEFVQSLPGGLDTPITEGGQNISVGQRQLVCLARALLRQTRILVLDEATAAVDVATDALIQGTIRENFPSCTVFTIAHRLNTIIDYDRIMVLWQGRILEFDSPKDLLARDSEFAAMLADSRRNQE